MCALLLLTASAAYHKSPRILLAVMKFFLGQDTDDDDSDDDNDNDEPNKGETAVQGPSKEDIYKAMHKVGPCDAHTDQETLILLVVNEFVTSACAL